MRYLKILYAVTDCVNPTKSDPRKLGMKVPPSRYIMPIVLKALFVFWNMKEIK